MSVKINLNWNKELQFLAPVNSRVTLSIDGNSLSGESPMKLLLHAVGACSGIDIVQILQKMRQELSHLSIEVTGTRSTGDYPRVWEKIHLHYELSGQLNKEKVEKAISLSLEKYCSVSAMLQKTASISSSFTIV